MKAFIRFIALLAVLFPGILMSASWKDYVSAQDEEVEWAATVRGVVRSKTGLAVLKNSTRDTYNFEPLLQSLSTLTVASDLILPIGGPGSGRRAELVDLYLRMIRFDRGERWRRLVFEQTREVAMRFPQRQVYWQIENEINSWHYGTSMSSSTGSDELTGSDPLEDIRHLQWDDAEENSQRKEERKESGNSKKRLDRNSDDVISMYVEYFLAPSAQAIIEARAQGPEYADRIKIVLGTIANSRSKGARNWLENLLNYRIRGDYAAQLAGRQVSDVIDIIALNYIVTSRGPEWRDALRGLYGKWLGTGSISGIWSTEEIGRKRAMANLGGATAISVLARYIDLWHDLGISPAQGRVNFWGWNMGDNGTRASDAMQTLMRLAGDTQLSPVPSGEVSLLSTEGVESYVFKSTRDQLLLVQFSANQESSFSFNSFRMKWEGQAEPNVSMTVFSAGGQREPEQELILENGYLTVSTAAVLSPRDVILVVVGRD